MIDKIILDFIHNNIQQFGPWIYLMIFAIVFAESGILAGFFLPGDSLLFLVGLLCAEGSFNLPISILLIFIAAVTGDSVGYAIGDKYGKKLFNKPDSLLFKREYLEKSQDYFMKNGPKAIILARFVPIVRTFAPVIAGVSDMNYKTFLLFNIVGGAIWTFLLVGLGFVLGKSIPNIDTYILPIVALIVIVSVGISVKEILHESKKKRNSVKA
jgi:membrane-associated protein